MEKPQWLGGNADIAYVKEFGIFIRNEETSEVLS